MVSIIPIFFLLAGLLCSIVGFALWIWMLVDCIKNEPSEGNDKLIWILVIVLVGWIGALVYLLIRRPQRIEAEGT